MVELKDVNLENCRKLSDASLDLLRIHASKLQVCPGSSFNIYDQMINMDCSALMSVVTSI